MSIPCFVYQAPGAVLRARYSYNAEYITTQAQLEQRLANGWHLTMQAAIDAAGDNAARHLAGRKAKVRRAKAAKPPKERRASVKRATMQEAIKTAQKPVNPVQEVLDYNAAPTREELVHKARELGLKFGGRTGNDKLLAMINEALGK
jgi:hypothetical protein